MRGLSISFVAGWLALVFACGDDGPGTGPASVASAEGPCSQICEANIRCGSTQTQAECTSECSTEVDGWVRQDALEIVADCVATLSCEADDDQCIAMVPALQEHRDWMSVCQSKLLACDGFDADICSIQPGSGDEGLIVLFTPAMVREMTACLNDNSDCELYANCLQTVFAKYGLDDL